MMNFEEQFPSLMKCKDGTHITEDIQKHCLDKAKVREAIDKIIVVVEQDAHSNILNAQLKKELGI